jgi:predicted TIM-barrel fold metal-dependent hydrolase
VIDCDQHLFEPRTMWSDYTDPGDRDVALALVDDDLGHTWLMQDSRRIELAFRQLPGDTEAVGRQVRRVRDGEAAEFTFEEVTPADYRDPVARLARLDEQGLDAAVLFPNFGLAVGETLSDDPRVLHANLGAWNRYAIEVCQQGRGRLHPVGHLTLGDLDWVDSQLRTLSAGGVRLAMISPAPVDGKRLSHPDLEPVWAAFVEHGITPVFHVGAFPKPFDPAWYEGDPDSLNPVLSSVFLGTPAALALADLAVHGTFERFPDLRLGVMELSAIWLPMFLLTLDGGFDFHAKFNGRPLTELAERPSDYVREHVRVAAFAYEGPDRLTEKTGDLFMMCSDYPHTEGTAAPLDDYRRMAPRTASPDEAPGLFGENVAWLLRQN